MPDGHKRIAPCCCCLNVCVCDVFSMYCFIYKCMRLCVSMYGYNVKEMNGIFFYCNAHWMYKWSTTPQITDRGGVVSLWHPCSFLRILLLLSTFSVKIVSIYSVIIIVCKQQMRARACVHLCCRSILLTILSITFEFYFE